MAAYVPSAASRARCEAELQRPNIEWKTITVDTVNNGHDKRAPGMFYGIDFPWNEAMLHEWGAEWLTKAFHAAGTLDKSNKVKRIVTEDNIKITTGNNGGKFLFEVEYEKPSDDLDTKLFAKVPFPLSGATKTDRLSSSVNKQPMEFHELNTSRLMEGFMPMKIPKMYYADISNETSNWILITECIKFAFDKQNYGRPGEKLGPLAPYAIEGPYDKCIDAANLRGPSIDYYLCLVKKGALLAGMQKSGTFSISEDIIKSAFSSSLDKTRSDFPMKADASSGEPKQQIDSKITSGLKFFEQAKVVFPDYVTTDEFKTRFRKCITVLNAYSAEIAFWKDAHNKDYTMLGHINMNVDNAYFWRDEKGEMDCGVLDWGAFGATGIGHKLWWWLYCQDYDALQGDLDVLLQAFVDVCHSSGGPKLDKAVLYNQFVITGLQQMIGLISAVGQINRMCKVENWKTIEDRYDPRIADNIDGKSSLRLYLHVMNSVIRMIMEWDADEVLYKGFVEDFYVKELRMPKKSPAQMGLDVPKASADEIGSLRGTLQATAQDAKTAKDYDVDLLTLDESLQGSSMVQHLQTKGFCKIRGDVDKEYLAEAVTETAQLDSQGRLFYPSVLLHEALMGTAGSSRIAKLQRVDAPDPQYSDGAHLQLLDEYLTDIAMIIEPYFGALGFQCSGRTVGMIHEGHVEPRAAAADAALKETKMTEEEASKWLVDLVRGKIMCIVCLGPTSGSMTLQPFSNSAESIEVPTNAGDVFLVRQDALIHRHAAKGKCMLMSCLYLMDKQLTSKYSYTNDLVANLSPAAKALVAWTEKRLATLKTIDMDEKEELPELPKEWMHTMNASYSTGQRIAICGLGNRIASSWEIDQQQSIGITGCDLGLEVPITRWDVNDYYDPDPDCWRMLKTWCRHASWIDGWELFDNKNFSLSPAEAGGMDPLQRFTLEVGYGALFQAGYKKKQLLNSFGSIYVGCDSTADWNFCAKADNSMTGSTATGAAASIICGRFSFTLGMKGPCLSVMMEEASTHLTMYLAASSITERGRFVKSPFALTGGGSYSFWPMHWSTQQSSGHLTHVGRCRSFDAYADGYMRADACGYAALKRHVEIVDGETVINNDAAQNCGVFAGGYASHAGATAGFGAPSGMGITEVTSNCLRTTCIEPGDVDIVECHGSGHFLTDAVEGRVYQKLWRPDSEDPMLMAANKTMVGNAMDGSGIQAMCKLLKAIAAGSACPNRHLLEMNPNLEAVDCPVFPNSEAMPFRQRATYGATFGTAFTGMQVSLIFHGQMENKATPEADDVQQTTDQLMFWPGGGGTLDEKLKPRRSYNICGTMTKWESVPMKERNAEHSFTFALGENRWEDFQIWLDGDSKKILTPGEGNSITGPHDGGGDPASLGSWRLDARPTYDLIWDEDGNETFREVQGPDTGLIGTQYKVMLKVAGRYLQVAWEKIAPDEKALAEIKDAAPKGSTAEYFIAGSWSGWSLQQMEKDKKVPGLFNAKCLATGAHKFVIVRNKSWSQVIYPTSEWASEDEEIQGPDEDFMSNAWYFETTRHDQGISISFQRTTEAGIDVMKISWKTILQDTQAALEE